MPLRRSPLIKGEVYHVFNKSLDKIPVFQDDKTCLRFLELLKYCRSSIQRLSYSRFLMLPLHEQLKVWVENADPQKNLVEIYSFQLMPNHYHFLFKQNTKNGITNFVGNLINSLTKYYNILVNRNGPIFLPRFKAVQILSEEQFIHTWRYIHLNPFSSGLVDSVEKLEKQKWSSYYDYMQKGDRGLVNIEPIMSHFGNDREKIRIFMKDQADYQRQLHLLKNLEP